MKYQYLIHQHGIVRFTDQGTGRTIVLLHGYLETLDIWNGFAEALSKNYRIICIDHMGHGKTRSEVDVFTTELSAELCNDLLNFLKIDHAFIMGHSMGGYTMLALEENYPNRVNGMCFFHSIAWADSDEKKENRDKEISFIKHGKRNILNTINLPLAFANDNLEKFKEELEKVKLIASETSDDGLIAALKGMKIRKDRTFVVEQCAKPILFFIGAKDNYIPKEQLLALADKAKYKKVVMLNESGHMGFIEEKEKCVAEVNLFLNNETMNQH